MNHCSDFTSQDTRCKKLILVDEDGQIRQRELPNLAIRHVYKQPGRWKNNLTKTKLRPGLVGSAFFVRCCV